ncbi:unnamed protein product [Prunus armeniaca]|uniref:FAD-binding domain-containing protein n=1 Tax=Prunus armeniaca TaxID=36596 RepID=A0A6J5V5Y5_PRUAR|nr:unnamed protein product [Prunus armeniaca]
MEAEADVVIVGAGISGLATSLGLHRLGIRSLVLESSDSLRTTGFALTTWTNAWKALDALGLADSLRQQHVTLDGLPISTVSYAKSVLTCLLVLAKFYFCTHETDCRDLNVQECNFLKNYRASNV